MTYKTYNNKLNSIKRKAERDYFSNQLDINKSDMKKLCKIMKSVIGNKRKTNQNIKRFKINNNIIDNDLRIAHEFNRYVVYVGPILAAHQIKTDLNPLHYVQNNHNSMLMQQIEHFEVVNVINSLNNSSPGWDGIPSRLAKSVLHSYIKPLTLLINKSFCDGIFPDELKLAKVIPIYKSGSIMELSNYRSISVLNIFSKIFERLMYNKLIQFFDQYNVLYKNQFGFRQGHSTHNALITLVDSITKFLDYGDIVIGVFIDIKKAFDTVNHKILLKKYTIMEFVGMYLTGESYLTNRSQMVLFNGKISDIRDVTCGVHQSSILGPLLFILYINDFAKVSDKLFHVLFADDTNAFLNGKNMNMLINTIQQELSRLYVWLLANKLSLNLSKTHFMVFHRARHKQYNIHIRINKVPIEQVKHTQF